ncbi:sensor histidine kinase [Reichenbachiella ulvae]|uniref:Histidine kinase n=1 Tax=Reichenbachiella ulvae TaxID=2980104 RepID=A0ABT3CMX4_9BACT|nr:histidine kinase [Reichenbachiella ulvae]MCV9385055.1 histidine kinase [Reichenbachiella ulvae]
MQIVPSQFQWIFRFKIHHLVFWMVYHFLWWMVYEGDPLNTLSSIFTTPYNIKYSFYVVFQALGVYFCLYYLIPNYLEKGKYLLFVFLLILTVIVMAGVVLSGYYLSAMVVDKTLVEVFGSGKNFTNPYRLFLSNTFPSSLASMTLGMSIKLAKNFVESQRREQALRQEKLETELKFLKSQFNPHFLFNTINSIFVLINKNKDLATDSLAKFSSLLRYQLYECNEAQIPLSRELEYVESFIGLEKLRLNENFEVEVKLPIQNVNGEMIAPFILMPFIENAFKHVSQHNQQKNWIKIEMTLNAGQLCFEVVNSSTATSEQAKEAVVFSGLGLENVRRRLALLYPNCHDLIVNSESGRFQIKLSISLASQTIISRAS